MCPLSLFAEEEIGTINIENDVPFQGDDALIKVIDSPLLYTVLHT